MAEADGTNTFICQNLSNLVLSKLLVFLYKMILQNSFLKKPFLVGMYLVKFYLNPSLKNISSSRDNLSLSKFNKIFKYSQPK